RRVRVAGTAACSTVPQAWQPPQRPDHFVARHPHSAHRYSCAAEELPMPGTVMAGADTPACSPGAGTPPPARGISWPREGAPGRRWGKGARLSLRTRSGRPLVALSTASAFPERVADAFELAARLGYDGLEVMVSADAVSQDTEALRRLAGYHGMP